MLGPTQPHPRDSGGSKITPELYVLHVHICGDVAVHSEREGASGYRQYQSVPLIVRQENISESDPGLPAIWELSAPEKEVEFIPGIPESKQQGVTVFLQNSKDVLVSLKTQLRVLASMVQFSILIHQLCDLPR